MNEIILGDYTLNHHPDYNLIHPGYQSYGICHYDDHDDHDTLVGWIRFCDDRSLYRIRTDDTDLIMMLLLKYQPAPGFNIYTY